MLGAYKSAHISEERIAAHRHSEAYTALVPDGEHVEICAVSGDVMQARIYGEYIKKTRNSVSKEEFAAMDQIDAMLRGRMGQLTGPSLVYLYSAGPVSTIDDVILYGSRKMDMTQ